MTENAVKRTSQQHLEVSGKIEPSSQITWLIAENPRSKGKATFDRFAKYFGSSTVESYLAAGGTEGDLRWDLRAGYLTVEGVTVAPPAEDKPKRVRKAKEPAVEAAAPAEQEVETETIG
jgi:hypothetical protein